MTQEKDFEHWFQTLAELAGENEAMFLAKRQLLLSRFLDAHEVNSDKLAALQVSIDDLRALSASPSDTLGDLMYLIADNATMLQRKIEELSRLLDGTAADQ